MKPVRSYRPFVHAILVTALLVQGAVLLQRTSGRASPSVPIPDLVTGSQVDEVRLRDAGGVVADLRPGHGAAPTVVLAFSSTCRFCDDVAGSWRDLLGRSGGVPVIAISDERAEQAAGYAERHGWEVDVRVTDRPRPEVERAIVKRTPWVFVIDGGGRIVYDGHGERLEEALRTAAGMSAGHRMADLPEVRE